MFSSVSSYFNGWFWPIAIISILVLTHAGRKCYIFGVGTYYLIFSKDKSFKMPKYDPGNIDKNNIDKIYTKTLICIRHSESTWNEVVNRKLSWKTPFRCIFALARESMLFVTADSCLFDAPLSSLGILQSKELLHYLKKGYIKDENLRNKNNELLNLYISILNGNSKKKSIIVSSPLRRCIETISIGLFNRLNNNNNENIILLSSLQEMTRNIDGVSLSSTNEYPPVSWSFKSLQNEFELNWDKWLENKLDLSNKDGLKSKDIRGDDRMRSFINWLFNKSNNDIIIISGHSLWFKKLFQAYLPRNCNHISKISKIINGGVVALQFNKYELSKGEKRYCINPNSIIPIFKGFIQKKKSN